MNTILARSSVIFVIVILAIFLFISGKEHAVFIINKGETYTPKNAYYILDDSEKEIKIKRKKKKRAYIKGTTHNIVVRFKDENGEEKIILKNFKTPMGKKLSINVAMIQDEDKWLKIEDVE